MFGVREVASEISSLLSLKRNVIAYLSGVTSLEVVHMSAQSSPSVVRCDAMRRDRASKKRWPNRGAEA